jgi:hypothetical protein
MQEGTHDRCFKTWLLDPLPGLITALAALLTAVGGIMTVLHFPGSQGQAQSHPPETRRSATDIGSPEQPSFPSGTIPTAVDTHSGFLIQSRNGNIGNFELVVPRSEGGLAHFWRDNHVPGSSWKAGAVFGTDLGQVDAVALIQSTFSEAGKGPGNLEVIARVGKRLVGFWHPDNGGDFRSAGAPEGSFTGNPALIQSRNGNIGNFELVVPRSEGGLAHFWRDNHVPGSPWKAGAVFGTDLGQVDAVALIQSTFSEAGKGPGNLEVIARVGKRLVGFWHPDNGGDFRSAGAP